MESILECTLKHLSNDSLYDTPTKAENDIPPPLHWGGGIIKNLYSIAKQIDQFSQNYDFGIRNNHQKNEALSLIIAISLIEKKKSSIYIGLSLWRVGSYLK